MNRDQSCLDDTLATCVGVNNTLEATAYMIGHIVVVTIFPSCALQRGRESNNRHQAMDIKRI
ncbi:hypothetical protein P692DRAFT_20829502 [Suillus brevipes Sb2]|nr:hypothetical protein P692DRAFT_20829502 [Suillus brevipes Sb2]